MASALGNAAMAAGSPLAVASNGAAQSTGWVRPVYWDSTFDGMVAVGMQEQARQAREGLTGLAPSVLSEFPGAQTMPDKGVKAGSAYGDACQTPAVGGAASAP
jgi:hypothetical protein